SNPEPEPIKIDTPIKIAKPTKQTPVKRLPFVINKLEPYNITNDILNTKVSMTIGQALQLPTQQKNLTQALKRKTTTTEANHVEPERNRKTVAMRCHVRIKGNPVVAILDSGTS
ncbi:21953_t:CDS:1, partial [Gigaspora rosea]